MAHNRFEKPVTVLIGMGLPIRIETVLEAYALLQDWPAVSRNGTHAIALNACKAGIAGDIDAETVRATFVAFASRNDILVHDVASTDGVELAEPLLAFRGYRGVAPSMRPLQAPQP